MPTGPLKPKPLSDSEEKTALDNFIRQPMKELRAEAANLKWVRESTLRDKPSADVSELAYFIELRSRAMRLK